MSEPKTDYDNLFCGLSYELISAMSALNMEPSPMEHDPDCIYLSEIDFMANHSYKHMQACVDIFCKLKRLTEKLLRNVDDILFFRLDIHDTVGMDLKQFAQRLDDIAKQARSTHYQRPEYMI